MMHEDKFNALCVIGCVGLIVVALMTSTRSYVEVLSGVFDTYTQLCAWAGTARFGQFGARLVICVGVDLCAVTALILRGHLDADVRPTPLCSTACVMTPLVLLVQVAALVIGAVDNSIYPDADDVAYHTVAFKIASAMTSASFFFVAVATVGAFIVDPNSGKRLDAEMEHTKRNGKLVVEDINANNEMMERTKRNLKLVVKDMIAGEGKESV